MRIEEIKEIANKYAAKVGQKITVPIVVNSRLTRTLGRCISKWECGILIPVRIQISGNLLAIASASSIEKVIAHQVAHYLVVSNTGDNHGHDSYFKDMCARIGTDNDKTHLKVEYAVPVPQPVCKYTLYCTKCRRVVGYRQRACNATKFPSEYRSHCCDAELFVSAN